MSNKSKVIHVARKLGPLRDKLIFVGGCAIEFLFDPDYPLPPRPTYDVDTIVEVCGRVAFSDIEEQLRGLGFKQNLNEEVICRWNIDGICVDVMPTDPKILGFSNRWYQEAATNAEKHQLEPSLDIWILKGPYLLATKLEAFEARGNNDFFSSHDLEDVLTLLDARGGLINEIRSSSSELQAYIRDQFSQFLKAASFNDAIPGHLSPYEQVAQKRIDRMGGVIKSLASLETM